MSDVGDVPAGGVVEGSVAVPVDRTNPDYEWPREGGAVDHATLADVVAHMKAWVVRQMGG